LLLHYLISLSFVRSVIEDDTGLPFFVYPAHAKQDVAGNAGEILAEFYKIEVEIWANG
jgi:hypothetical protein